MMMLQFSMARAIDNMNRSARKGDVAGAERWLKLAERIGVLAEKINALADDEAVRLRRRQYSS